MFRGEVRAREALQHSLNLPAVAALSAIGADRFLASIGAAGIDVKARTTAGKKPGLALALGGAGVTAQDLGRLYAGLADGGVMKPLDWTETQQDATAYRLFSDDAARRINAILADAPALEGRAPAALARGAARIAFKTGTSYGFATPGPPVITGMLSIRVLRLSPGLVVPMARRGRVRRGAKRRRRFCSMLSI